MADPLTHPAVGPETLVYWQAIADGKLMIKHCSQCDRSHFYPRTHCPHCHAASTDWREATGRGTIYSYCVMRREVPQRIVAYVTLAEGPTIFTNIVGVDPDVVRIGTEVRLDVTTSAEGLPMSTFTI